MITINRIRKRYNGYICRRCINEVYDLKLVPIDCEYGFPYPYMCPRCEQMRNIVTGFKVKSRIQLMMKNPPPGQH